MTLTLTNKLACFAISIGLTLTVAGCTSPNSAKPTNEASKESRTIADRVVRDFAAERFDDVESIVETDARSTLSTDEMRKVWSDALQSFGSFKSQGKPVTSRAGSDDLFDYPLTFEHGNAHFQVALNDQGRVTGLYLVPGQPTGKFGK